MNKLSLNEAGQLIRLEKTIRTGKQSFLEVGRALIEIRDRKLYRETHDNFEQYCQEKWEFSHQNASNLINSTAVVQALPKNLATTVANERTARALVKLPAEKRVEVLAEIKKSGQPATSKSIKETHEKNQSQVQNRNADASADKPALEYDDTGHDNYPGCLIPKRAEAVWMRKQEAQDILSALSRIKSLLKKAQESKDILFYELNTGAGWQRVFASLENLYSDLSLAKPYAVCPDCQGKLPDKCRTCGGRGVVSKFRFSTTPEPLRKMRERSGK